jgi:molecular chaperone DnaK
MARFVGIDLGTTFSVVAYIRSDGTPQAIRNDMGSTLMPSVIYLGTTPPLVGQEAKERQALGETEVAAFFKRHMGDPNFVLEFGGQQYAPTDLSALVLSKLKQTAESYLGEPVPYAVITVPAYFNNLQREATVRAGEMAGFEVLRIIMEPTAAALAYGIRPGHQAATMLVYDLGGGTFDISLVEVTPEELSVIATDGDHFLGGKDWDDRIFNYLSTQFDQEFTTELDGEGFNELLVQSEHAKRTLSTRQVTRVTVQGAGHVGRYELSREHFEILTRDLMERTEKLTEQVLEDAQLTWRDITGVLLVGGSTRMPMVRKYVERMSGKPALGGIHPDEAVALGAAIQAQIDMESAGYTPPLLGLPGRKKITDVMSHSLGMIAVSEDGKRYRNSIILKKNEPIPYSESRQYQLEIGRSREAQLEVYLTQGESDDPLTCIYLGKYVFSNFPSNTDRVALIDITYTYNQNGIVEVKAVEHKSGRELTCTKEPLPTDVPDRFARPLKTQVVQEELTVYLAFDLSGSMSGTPLSEAQKAAHAFVSQCDLDHTAIGLISFSDTVLLETEATSKESKISAAIDGLRCGRTGYGNATHPFDEIYHRLHTAFGFRYALVLADGVWAHQKTAIRQAERCHEDGIEIIAVGFGGADEAFLRAISSSDEQSIFTDMNRLSATFSTIAQELSSKPRADKNKGLLSALRILK